jgi:signal transduction histidine kinase
MSFDLERIAQSAEARLLADAFPSFLAYVDPDYRYRFVNAAYSERLARPRGEVIGKRIDEIWGEELAKTLRPNIARGLAGERFAVEYLDAELGSVTTYVPHEVDGEVVGVIVFSSDARQVQRARNAELHAEKMTALRQLVAGVLHELNTPLAVIKSGHDMAGRALGKIDGGARALDLLKPARVAIERIERVLDDLRRLTRLDQAEVQNTDVHECIECALTLATAQLGPKLQLERDLGEPLTLICRPADLTQLLLTIFRSALDARRDDRMAIACGTEGSQVVITTSYAGETIDFAVVDARKANVSLLQCRHLAEQLGGTLQAVPDGDRTRVELRIALEGRMDSQGLES